jgi:hypothetical protein
MLRWNLKTIASSFLTIGQHTSQVCVTYLDIVLYSYFNSDYPNGQVPALEVDGQMLTQSHAIGRYLANKFGKYIATCKSNRFWIIVGIGGKDDWEAAKADSYIDGVEDTLRDTVPLIQAALFGKGDKVIGAYILLGVLKIETS